MLLPARTSGAHGHVRRRAYVEVRDGALKLTCYATLLCETAEGQSDEIDSVDKEPDETLLILVDEDSLHPQMRGCETDDPFAEYSILRTSRENEDAFEEAVFPQ